MLWITPVQFWGAFEKKKKERIRVWSAVPGNLTWLAANVAWTQAINLHHGPAFPRCWVCIWTSVAGLCREWKNIINTWIRRPFEAASFKLRDLALSWGLIAHQTETRTHLQRCGHVSVCAALLLRGFLSIKVIIKVLSIRLKHSLTPRIAIPGMWTAQKFTYTLSQTNS